MRLSGNDSRTNSPCTREEHYRAIYKSSDPTKTSIIMNKVVATRHPSSTREDVEGSSILTKDYESKINAGKVEDYIAFFYWKHKTLEKYLARWKQCHRNSMRQSERADMILKNRSYLKGASASQPLDNAATSPLPIPFLLAFEFQRHDHRLQQHSVAPLVAVSPSSTPLRPNKSSDSTSSIQMSRSGPFLQATKIKRDVAAQNQQKLRRSFTIANLKRLDHSKLHLRMIYYAFKIWSKWAKDESCAREELILAGARFWRQHVAHRIWAHWKQYHATKAVFRRYSSILQQSASKIIQVEILGKFNFVARRRQAVRFLRACTSTRCKMKAVANWYLNTQFFRDRRKQDAIARSIQRQRIVQSAYSRWNQLTKVKTLQRTSESILEASRNRNAAQHIINVWKLFTLMAVLSPRFGDKIKTLCYDPELLKRISKHLRLFVGVQQWKKLVKSHVLRNEEQQKCELFQTKCLLRRYFVYNWVKRYREWKDRERSLRHACELHKMQLKKFALAILQGNWIVAGKLREIEKKRKLRLRILSTESAFQTWKSCIHHTKKLIKAQIQWQMRRLIKYVSVWKHSQSALQRQKGWELGSLMLRARKLSIWVSWKRIWMIRLKIKHQQERYSRTVKTKSWNVWRSYVSYSKLTRKVSTTFQTFSRRELCKRPFFHSWTLFAMQNRCRKEIARLSRRKCVQKRVKSMLKRWRIRVLCVNFQTASKQRILSTTLHCWKTITMNTAQRGEYSAVADDFFRLYSYRFALQSWKRYHTHVIPFRAKKSMASEWFATHLIYKSFRDWRRLTCKTKRIHHHEMVVQARRNITLSRQIWHHWKTFSAKSKRKRLGAAFMHRSFISKSFHCWIVYVSDMRERKQSQKLSIQHFNAVLKLKILLKWHLSAFQQRRWRERFQQLRKHLVRRSMQKAVNVWHSLFKVEEMFKINNRTAIDHYTDLLKLTAFFRWHQWLFLRCSIRLKLFRFDKQNNDNRLAKAVCIWSDLRLKRIHEREKDFRIVKAMKKLSKAMCFRNWHRYAAKKSKTTLLIVQRSHYRRRLQLSNCWSNWRSHVARVHKVTLGARKMFHLHALSILCGIYKRWKANSKRRVKKRQAKQIFEKRLRSKTLESWILYHQYKAPKFIKKQVALQRRKALLLQEFFLVWKRHLIDQRKLNNCIFRIQITRVRKLYALAFHRMQEWSIARKNICKAQILYHATTCRHFLYDWRYRVRLVRRRKDATKIINRLHFHTRSHLFFIHWHNYYQSVTETRWCTAVELHTKAVITNYWNRWLQSYVKHTRWNLMKKRALLGQAFQSWCTIHYQKKDQSVRDKNASVMIRRILAHQVCIHWSQWALNHHHQREQLYIATSKFCNSSVKHKWTCWKRFCKNSKYSHATKAQAELIIRFRTQKCCFDKWLLYLDSSKAKMENDSQCTVHIQNIRARQSVRCWNRFMSERKQFREQALVAQECDRLRLLCIGVTCLVDFNQKKRRYVEAHEQAIDFYARHNRVKFFLRWLLFVNVQKTTVTQYRAYEDCKMHTLVQKWLSWTLRSKKRKHTEQCCQRYRESTWQSKSFHRWRLALEQTKRIERINFIRHNSLLSRSWNKWRKSAVLSRSTSAITRNTSICRLQIFDRRVGRVPTGAINSSDPHQSKVVADRSCDATSARIAAHNLLRSSWRIWVMEIEVKVSFRRRVRVAAEAMITWKKASFISNWIQCAKYQSQIRKVSLCIDTKPCQHSTESIWYYWRRLFHRRRERLDIASFQFKQKRLRQGWKALRSNVVLNQRMRLSLRLMHYVIVSYYFQGWRKYTSRKVALIRYLSRRKHKAKFKFWRKWATGMEKRKRVRKKMEEMKEKRQSCQLYTLFTKWDDHTTGNWIVSHFQAILREHSLQRRYRSAISKWKRMILL